MKSRYRRVNLCHIGQKNIGHTNFHLETFDISKTACTFI